MQKDFDKWNEEKKCLDIRQDVRLIFCKERDIWWCRFGLNIGYEQDGKGEKFLRPVLILKKLSPNTFVGLPLTLKTRQHRYFLDCHAMDKVRRQVLLSQLITFDIKRLHERMTVVGEDTFTIIRKAVRNLF